MRLKTGIKLTLVATAVALGGFGLGLAGGPDADAGARDIATRPVVAIDKADPTSRLSHQSVDCPLDDRDRGTVLEPTSGRGV